MPEAVFVALAVTGRVESGRAVVIADALDERAGFEEAGDVAADAAEAADVEVDRAELGAGVGRSFLLARSTDKGDCQDRLCDRMAAPLPVAESSGLEGEAYFWRVSWVG
jgi:hypothetical protein